MIKPLTNLMQKFKDLFQINNNDNFDWQTEIKDNFSLSKEEILYRLPMIECPFVDERYEEIQRITNYAKQNNINIIFYYSPLYYKVYQYGNIDNYNNMKRKVANITPFYDFSGINEITTQKKYFCDLIHINTDCTKIIINRLFSENKNNEPKFKNFGNYVTKENIDKHIEIMNTQKTDN